MATIQGDGFIVNIIKSKRRKTMVLKVDANGVSAHIPSSLPLTTTTAFIEKKTSWIKNKLAQQQQRNVEKKQFVNGEIFLLLGENVTLHLFQADKKAIVKKTATTIEFYGRLNRLSKSAIRAAILSWYKNYANNYLTARTQWLSDVTGLHPHSVTVKSYKARWGSCSS